MSAMGATQEEYYRGVRMVPYDLLKELALAMAAVGVLALLLSAFLSSPDVPPVTIATWSQSDPIDFVTTSTGELAGTTGSAGYGQPYNSTPDAFQHWGPIAPQAWFGVRIPVDSADAFVIKPLQRASFSNTALGAALTQWEDGTSDQQAKWLDAYTTALADATIVDGQVTVVRWSLRAAPGDDVEPSRRSPNGRPGRPPRDQRPVLSDRLHAAAALHG